MVAEGELVRGLADRLVVAALVGAEEGLVDPPKAADRSALIVWLRSVSAEVRLLMS